MQTTCHVRIGSKRLCLLLPFLLILLLLALSSAASPRNAFAVTQTNWGNSINRAGYQVDTSSTIVAEVGHFRSSSSVYIDPSAVPGALQVKNTMRVGVYASSAYAFSRETSYVVNGSQTTMLTATQTYNYSSNPGWGDVASEGTAMANLNGWISLYTGRANVWIPTRSFVEFSDPILPNGYTRVQGINGNIGYVKTCEESPGLTALSPSETLDFYRRNEGMLYIDVYDESFKNVIDQYVVSFSVSDQQVL